MVRAGETAHITGTDADGNAFEYGIENLITKCEEQSYQTTEVKTNQTWIDGKPIYRIVFEGTTYNDFQPNTAISNLDALIKMEGMAMHTNGLAFLDLGYASIDGVAWTSGMYYQKQYGFRVNAGTSFIGSYTSWRALLYYTKTTD